MKPFCKPKPGWCIDVFWAHKCFRATLTVSVHYRVRSAPTPVLLMPWRLPPTPSWRQVVTSASLRMDETVAASSTLTTPVMMMSMNLPLLSAARGDSPWLSVASTGQYELWGDRILIIFLVRIDKLSDTSMIYLHDSLAILCTSCELIVLQILACNPKFLLS